MSLNIRNSKLDKKSTDYLAKCLNNAEIMLTALSLKYCFLNFEQILPISNSLRFSKNLVKFDLSNNGLKPAATRFLLDAI